MMHYAVKVVAPDGQIISRGEFSSPDDIAAAERARTALTPELLYIELRNTVTGCRQILGAKSGSGLKSFQFAIIRLSDGEWVVSGDISARSLQAAADGVGKYFALHNYSCYDYEYLVVDVESDTTVRSWAPKVH